MKTIAITRKPKVQVGMTESQWKTFTIIMASALHCWEYDEEDKCYRSTSDFVCTLSTEQHEDLLELFHTK